jgi:transglutaminase-like putative cysteine protease
MQRRSIASTAVAALGLAAVGVASGPGLVVGGAALLGLLSGRLWGGAPSPAALRTWRLANAAALVMALLLVFLVSDRLMVGAGLVGWLLVHRAWTGRTPSDDRITLLLSTLGLLLACILSLDPLLLGIFFGFALLAPLALVQCLLDEAAPPGAPPPRVGALWAVGPAVIVIAAGLFVVLPRVQGGIGAGLGPAALPGFQPQVALGDHAMSRFNPDEVLRVVLTDQDGAQVEPPVYMRGVALDVFDGDGWRREPQNPVKVAAWPELPGTARWWVGEVTQVNTAGGALFTPPEMHALVPQEGSFHLRMDMSRNARGPTSLTVLRYTTYSVPYAPGALPAESAAIEAREAGLGRLEKAGLRSGLWTELPPGLDPRVAELAERLRAAAGPEASERARVEAVLAHFADFQYTLDPQPEHAGQPLSTFLFDAKSGHCEYFATGLAVLLRAQGVPARVVNGLYGGELNPYGGFLVFRQQDAHSWVEAWVGGRWVLLDATPEGGRSQEPDALRQIGELLLGSYRSIMLDYDLAAQLDGLGALRDRLGDRRGLGAVALGGAFVFGLGWLGRVGLRRLAGAAPRRPADELGRLHAQAEALVRSRGWPLAAELPAVAAAERLVAEAGPLAEPLLALAWLRYRARLGGEPAAALRAEAQDALRALRQLPRRGADR